MRLTARVPATAANLGPGFDCLGLALDLCNEFTVDTEAEPGITWEGEGAGELPTDGSDMVSRAMRVAERRIAEAHGAGAFEVPALALHGTNRIPLDRGLGSSAAAAVAGVTLAYRLLDLDDPDSFATTALWLAAEIEGHPDNAAAAALGGLTIVAADDVERLDPHPGVRPILFVPDEIRLSTEDARRAIPETVTREDAVFNVGHAALTVARLLHDPDRLRLAMRDRLHQDARLALVPQARELYLAIEEAGLPVCVSGSGPTLLAFERDGRDPPDPGDGWRVLRVPVRATGVEILEA
ncbi:MAG TPA: homoserine kinase [Actinomycetota bacterium]|nr:homoserine kinase [Actinomycetota bacterium]